MFVGKWLTKEKLRRLERRREDNIKKYLKELRVGDWGGGGVMGGG
jgi:hypothetical protein